MTSSTASTATPTHHVFERRVEDVKPSKTYVKRELSIVFTTPYPLSSYDDLQSNGNLSEIFTCGDYVICISESTLSDLSEEQFKDVLQSTIRLMLEYPDSDINALILDYLTAEGYPSAADRFSKEANLKPLEQQDSIVVRDQIKHDIHLGNIQNAIEAINEVNPQILDSDSSLHFALLRLQLIELIRTCNAEGGGNVTPAISFATTHLAPRASTNPQFLNDLELTMALILFPPDNLEPRLAVLLHPDLRKNVADRVNKAILASQGQRREAAIRNLVRLRAWAEETARGSKKDMPSHLDIGLDAGARNEGSHGNGHEAMAT